MATSPINRGVLLKVHLSARYPIDAVYMNHESNTWVLLMNESFDTALGSSNQVTWIWKPSHPLGDDLVLTRTPKKTGSESSQ